MVCSANLLIFADQTSALPLLLALPTHGSTHRTSSSPESLSAVCQNHPTWCETVVRVRGGDHAKDHRDYTEGVWVRFPSNHLLSPAPVNSY